MPKMIFVNLPVADLDRSVAFYEKHDDLVGPLFNFSVKGTF